MNLIIWMRREKITAKKLCAMTGTDVSNLSRYLNGKIEMPKHIAEKIVEISGGEVSRIEAYWPDYWVDRCPHCSKEMFLRAGASKQILENTD